MHKIYNLILGNIITFLYLIKRNLRNNEKNNFEIIIFSHNRPLQLQCLLESAEEFVDKRININVLYKTNEKNNKSYQILQNNLKSNPKINFTCEESTFRKSLNLLLKKISQKNLNNMHLLFFVDDQIIFRRISLNKLNNLVKLATVCTLRFGLNTTWSFNLDKKQSLYSYKTKIKNEYISWYPNFKNDELSYVFSFDGSTIPIDLFRSFSNYLIFKGPNSLESAMNYSGVVFKLLKNKISSFTKQGVINIVISTVQNETKNRGDFLEIEYLNNLFLKNWKLKLDMKKVKDFNSPHSNEGVYLEKSNKIKILKKK